MVKRKYIATVGAPFAREKAQAYGQELDRISKENKGQMNAKDVVEIARDINNPLHNYFEWDDTDAADKHRVYQARLLINHITVIVKYNGNQKAHRAFYSVNSTPNAKVKNRTYVTIENVLSKPELREQVITNALREIKYWKVKYSQYLELAKIFKAIEETEKKVSARIITF